MAAPWYEPLPASDRTFLLFEDSSAHMHLGGVALFEAGPLRRADGSIDIARIRAHVAGRLHLRPRYRQRLGFVPIRRRPIWVDDQHFSLSYHVRHTAIPKPGDDAQLKRLAARILSQQLDRGKPLWELWVIEGLQRDRFAMLVKTHHCMADGISAFDLFAALLGPAPDEQPDPPQPWAARPSPDPIRLVRDELVRSAVDPWLAARDIVREALRSPGEVLDQARETVTAIVATIGSVARPVGRTPLNGPIGPHRRFDWLSVDLHAVRRIKDRLGGTVNDVVLAIVAGAVRRFLLASDCAVTGLTFRAVIPVSVRTTGEQGLAGNQASGWLLALPVHEPDPHRRLALVQEETRRLKRIRPERGPMVLGRAAEWAAPGVLTLGVRLTAHLAPYNLIVTNVPGPQLPLYLLGARLIAGFPQVPLFDHQGLGLAIFSYDGQLGWGFNADRELVPDLSRFVEAVSESFHELIDGDVVDGARVTA